MKVYILLKRNLDGDGFDPIIVGVTSSIDKAEEFERSDNMAYFEEFILE